MTFSDGSNFPSPPRLTFDFSNIQLIFLLHLSCPHLIPPACLKHGCYSLYLAWNPFVSFSHSIAPDSPLIPLRIPWTFPFPCPSVFVLYWSVTPICFPAAKFHIPILEFCGTKHWESFTFASALIFWRGKRANKHNITFHRSLKSMWTPVSTDSALAGTVHLHSAQGCNQFRSWNVYALFRLSIGKFSFPIAQW